jgi:membrane protein implicated in regulation of membrane protease activity
MENGFDISPWLLWFAAAIVLMVLEVFVPGFVLGCLAIGALGGMVASWVTEAWEIQLLVASVAAAVAFVFIRPFALKKLFRENELKTNIDSLVGRRARVSQAFDMDLLKGRVAVDGDDWMAISYAEGDLQEGAAVIIEKVDSNTLIVKPLNT